ncbi:M protein, serotype 6-like [Acropora muricata]|uniref:M protein, serotype 6-like n=1 Tax=Acropora muricata TaxID=159855 RepID=UPI0034E53693
MPKHKKGQRDSSLSSSTSPAELKKVKMSEEEVVENASLKHLIQNLTETMEGNFGNLHEELSAIRQEMKHEIETVKDNVKNVEKIVEEVWANVNDLKEELKALKNTKNAQEKELEGLRSLLRKSKVGLKEEREKIIEFQDFTRRENLKFYNSPESNFEGDTQSAKQVIVDIL